VLYIILDKHSYNMDLSFIAAYLFFVFKMEYIYKRKKRMNEKRCKKFS